MILDLLLDWLPADGPWRLWGDARRLVAFWSPVMSVPGLIAPVSLLSSLLALVVLSGIAIASLGMFLSAALVLYLLLSQVFGLSVELMVA